MYLRGFLVEIIRRIYSIEKNIVITHSEITKISWYLLSKFSTVSNNTNTTLNKMTNNKMMSNNFPAGVFTP
jgi:hypothetical protein